MSRPNKHVISFMLHDVLTNPAWLAVVIAVGALIPQVKKARIWSWRKWRDWRNTIPTQGAKDRKNYGKLLDQYEKYLSLLERVMNLRENRIEMRIPRSVWFP
jgi:hypothetical protein